MTNDRCKGCQSFCMRGAQCAGQAPGKSTDPNYTGQESKKNYPTTWHQWSNFKGEGADATTIQSSTGLTAQSQIDFVTFVKNTFEEGEVNISNMSKFLSSSEGQKQINRRKHIPSCASNPSDSSTHMENATIDHENENCRQTIKSGSIIYHQNFNDLTSPLNGDTYSAVTRDSLNKSNISNTPSQGKVAGFGGEKSKKQKDDQIFAQDYIDLANKAKSLLYHPYQCNICNVCEGNEWMEIVKEVYGKVAEQHPTYYPGTESIRISINGLSFNLRPDCSGVVAACLFAFDPKNIPSSAPAAWSTHGMGPNGEYGAAIKAAGFTWHGGTNGSEPGDIQLHIQKHTQIISEEGNAYSGGSTEGLAGKRSSINNYTYDGIWRLENQVGNFSSGTYANNIQNGGDIGENEEKTDDNPIIQPGVGFLN